jgi:hypothetical protein
LAEYEHVETATGDGEVFSGECLIASVTYMIEVKQEIVNYKTAELIHRMYGPIIVNGLIVVAEGERDLAEGVRYLLKLDDGRRLNFLISSGDRVAGRYVIQPAGLKGLEPQK